LEWKDANFQMQRTSPEEKAKAVSPSTLSDYLLNSAIISFVLFFVSVNFIKILLTLSMKLINLSSMEAMR
jgi:hypothetical protein